MQQHKTARVCKRTQHVTSNNELLASNVVHLKPFLCYVCRLPVEMQIKFKLLKLTFKVAKGVWRPSTNIT